MMYPILMDIKFESLPVVFRSRDIWKDIAINLVVNWIISPLVMFGLAWAFLPDQPELREGLILVGIARCIAMVLLWIRLSNGDTQLGAILVALNALLQMALYAPISVLFLQSFHGGAQQTTSVATASTYKSISISVAVFLGIPLGLAAITRLIFLKAKPLRFGRFKSMTAKEVYENVVVPVAAPLALLGLLATIVILFVAQGHHVVKQITSALRVAAPLVMYFPITFLGTLVFCWKLLPRAGVIFATHESCLARLDSESQQLKTPRKQQMPFNRATMHAFLAASNNFELAIAIAAAQNGAMSKQSLATSVGPLIEVPVMLGLVWVAGWLEKRWD